MFVQWMDFSLEKIKLVAGAVAKAQGCEGFF